MKKVAVIALFFLLAFLLPARAAISSEQAKSAASVYLEKGATESLVLSGFNPIEYKSDRYWIVYVTPQDSPRSKQLIIAVRDEDGLLETNENILRSLVEIDYGIDLLLSLQEKKIAYTDLKAILGSAKLKTFSNARTGLNSVESQSSKYPSISFLKLDNALQDVEKFEDDLLTDVGDALAFQNSFEQTSDVTSLNTSLNLFPKTLDSFTHLADLADAFQKAVSEKQVEVLKSDVPDAGSLYKSLEAMKDVGADASLKTSIEARKKEFEAQLARKPKYLNDSISSFYFRKGKTDARKAFDAASPKVEPLLRASLKPDLDSCKISVSELRSDWSQISLIMQSPSSTTAQYSAVPEKASQALVLADEITGKLNRCLQGAPTPKPEEFDFNKIVNPVLLVVFVGILAYGVYQFKKKQEEMQQ